jgi:hypothetical protein
MNHARTIRTTFVAIGLASALLALPPGEPAGAAENEGPVNQTHPWSGGMALGFVGNTPDATALALNFNIDRFLTRQVSVGPLLQLGVTGDLTQVGTSGQAKYWLDISETDHRAKLVLQGGFGFVHAGLYGTDTSWLIPLGVGLDYKVDRTLALSATFLLNFTDVEPSRGAYTSVMPGLTFGIRF